MAGRLNPFGAPALMVKSRNHEAVSQCLRFRPLDRFERQTWFGVRNDKEPEQRSRNRRFLFRI